MRAFKLGKGASEFETWEHPNTVAGGSADVYPWDGDAALSALEETGIR